MPTSAVSPSRVRIAATGDIMLGGTGRVQLNKRGYNYPFVATQNLLQGADVVIGNLETALTERDVLYVDKKYRFRNAPDKVPSALRQAGFNLVSLANNHSMDYGVEGLADTMAALASSNIHFHGAGNNVTEARKPVVFVLANGQRLGFLAYSLVFPEEFWASDQRAGTAFGHEEWVRADVSALKQQVDLVVVSFHWGTERSTVLRDYQPKLAHAAIEAGADLVLGHHPHCLQGIELYKDKPIVYSLGNYTFASYSNGVSAGGIANVFFVDGKFDSLELTPININNFQVELQPALFQEHEARQVYEQLALLSREVNTTLTWEHGKILLRASSADP